MIYIKRLVGESYDFDTGQEIDRGFVLSNGKSERTVAATPEQIQVVLELFQEQAAFVVEQHAPSSSNQPRRQAQQPQPSQRNGKTQPIAPVEPEGEKEPGEEYDDEHGTQSI